MFHLVKFVFYFILVNVIVWFPIPLIIFLDYMGEDVSSSGDYLGFIYIPFLLFLTPPVFCHFLDREKALLNKDRISIYKDNLLYHFLTSHKITHAFFLSFLINVLLFAAVFMYWNYIGIFRHS